MTLPFAPQLQMLLDVVGTFAFALSGALVATRRRLDLFGVLVLSFAAATAGGMVRDVLLGATPPVAIVDWRYLAVSSAAGLLTFYRHALGLARFAVLGAGTALAAGLGPVGAVMLGMLTGVGGGIVRDVLVAQVPHVLQRELYAIAALLGATVVVVGHAFGLPPAPTAIVGALLCFVVRWFAIRRGWHLPVAKPRP